MVSWISALLAVAGAFFMFTAALGVLRLPDFYMRVSAVTKASGLGVVCILAAAAVHFANYSDAGEAIAIAVFIFLTVPVSSHRLSRVAYLIRVPLWKRTRIDELKGKYDRESLRSHGEP